MGEGKSINALMKHMREKHNIKIGTGVNKGGTHKKNLKNLGYYHGFKGYKFIKDSNNCINFNDFNEIVNLNKFDMELKTLIYPKIMFLETAIKNHTLEVIFTFTNKIDFESIYNDILIDYKDHINNNKKHKKAINDRLKLRADIYTNLNRNFSNDTKVIEHFYKSNKDVPIWAIFEVMMMGTLGLFISCMRKDIRKKLSDSMNLNISEDTDSKFATKIIYILKDLRNSVAHNNVIFDSRFKSGNIDAPLKNAISIDTGINNLTFNSIVDYIILIVYLLKGIGENKTELRKFVKTFENIIEEFRNNIDIAYYNKIIPTDTRNKLNSLNNFISK